MKCFRMVAVLPVVLIFCASSVIAQTNNVYFNGHGYSSAYNSDFTIIASKDKDNFVRGGVVWKLTDQGAVFELVQPAGLIDYWCMATSLEGSPGDTLLLFIKDNLSIDEISFNVAPGLSCTTSVPGVGTFQSIDVGGFVGEVVPDTCAADLATCQSVRNQCQSDLAAFTSGCNLPSLISVKESRLNGAVKFSPPISGTTAGKVNIKVKKILNVVTGTVKLPDGTITQALDLVPPHNCVNYWCVEDTNGLWFVRDVGTGCDLVSYRAGTALTCADAPVNSFDSGLPGDFKGMTRGVDNKTCPE